MVGLGILLVLVIGVLSLVGMYNGLVKNDENINSKWAQIDNQLQRRSDLIPNLVGTVKGFAAHEQGVIKAISDARAKMGQAQSPVQKAEANGELNGALSRLMMIQENYPNLKADAHFQSLMNELAGTENRIAVARKDYNDSVQVFNAKIKTFPTTIMANMAGYSSREYFKVDESAKKVPVTSF